MDLLRIIFIALGILTIIISVCNLLHFNSPLFITKHMREVLSESERIEYQKSTAKPWAVLGGAVVILGVFCVDQAYVFAIGYIVSMSIFCFGWP
jgi:hypothetical protein